MADFRKDALIKTLREDYGITTVEQLLNSIRDMTKLDITQFILYPDKERTKKSWNNQGQPAIQRQNLKQVNLPDSEGEET